MKEKVKNILDKYGLIDENYPVVINEIDTLYKVDFEKRVAFKVACNPDIFEAQTNYKLYEGEIKQLKEIIQSQDELILKLFAFHQDTNYFKAVSVLQDKITELKKGVGL